ncbi:hypothetical protein [Pelagibius marinus]|uniref:hypothetical protein n=1 Tax=Pelagibius marinus TaxID=2762760 RepID=UPI001872EB47|nr:hypothetical protein [Pelagibius marinus]
MVLHKLIPVVAGAGLVLALAACDESEQGRILRYEKGTYLGKADSPLSDEKRDELRSRAMMQSGG